MKLLSILLAAMVSPSILLTNENGGHYVPGRCYGFETKARVRDVYLELCAKNPAKHPSSHLVAKQSGVGKVYALRVIKEIDETGDILATSAVHEAHVKSSRKYKRKAGSKTLSIADEIYLLALRTSNDCRSLSDYVSKMNELGVKVSCATVSKWFKTRFKYKGIFKKPNLIPIDKYRIKNIRRYVEFMKKKELIKDHTIFNFLDEKHIMNKDTYPKKCRANPLTGIASAIAVSGDFREAYNLLAIITENKKKLRPVAYTIGQFNGTSDAFVEFIKVLIVTGFLQHDEALIMDNAAIHTGGRAEIVEDLLWNCVVDGRPLRILDIYLPKRSPELNPIELIFNILASRVRSWRCKAGPFDGKKVVKNVTEVLDNMDFPLILRCCRHCGYDVGV